MAFMLVRRESNTAPTIERVTIANDEVLANGVLVNLETGELDLAVTGDTALVGAVIGTYDNSADGLTALVVTDSDAIYAVDDANIRLKGATLDIASGALGVTTSSNADLIVVESSTASEPTLVTFNQTHYLT